MAFERRKGCGWEIFVALFGAAANAIIVFALDYLKQPGQSKDSVEAAAKSTWELSGCILGTLGLFGGVCMLVAAVSVLGKLLDLFDIFEIFGIDFDHFDG